MTREESMLVDAPDGAVLSRSVDAMEGVETTRESSSGSLAEPSCEWSGRHTWVVENFTNPTERKLYSDTFDIGSYSWRLLIFPKGNETQRGNDHVAVYLDFPEASYTPQHMCPKARFELVAVNQLDNARSMKREASHTFTNNANDWGFTQFLTVADAMDESKGYVIDDKLELKVSIKVQREDQVYRMTREETGFVGLKNQGATCYMNSLLQYLYHISYFRKAVYHMPTLENDEPDKSIPLALQSLFFKLQYQSTSVNTKDLTKSFGWGTYDAFLQHDIQEMEAILCEKLEEKMKGTKVEKAIEELFQGHYVNEIDCTGVEYKSSTRQIYMEIPLDVQGCSDIYASFDKFCEEEMMVGQNQYKAEGHGFVDARRYTLFESFPPVLQLHLKRFDYDPMRNMMIKINSYYKFDTELDLDIGNRKYLVPGSDESVRNMYRLHSVLVHSGGAHGGHYFAFFRPKGDKWLKFDDEMVKAEIQKKAVDDQYGEDDTGAISNFGGGGLKYAKQSTAYMLVYIRESDWDRILCDSGKEDLVEHVRRRLEAEQEEKERRQKEKLEAHMYVVIKVACDTDFSRQIGDTHYFDLVDFEDVKSYRIHKKTSFQDFKGMVAKDFSVPVECQRYWVWSQRQNATTRPDSPLMDQRDIQTVLDLRQHKEKPYMSVEKHALMTIKLYLEKPDTATGTLQALSANDLLLFCKLYDPYERKLTYVGHIFVDKSMRFKDIFTSLKKLVGLNEKDEILAYEEVKFEPAVMCNPLDEDGSPERAQFLQGDIICIQRKVAQDEVTEMKLNHPTVKSFLEYIQNSKIVNFRPLDNPKDDGFKLELLKTMSYEETTGELAKHLGIDDGNKIRLTQHNIYAHMPHRSPIKYRGMDNLESMILHSRRYTNILYYEVLDLPLSYLEKLKCMKVQFFNEKVDMEGEHLIRLPKDNKVEDLIETLRTELGEEYDGKEFRLMEITGSKIFKICDPDSALETLQESYWTFRAEVVPQSSSDCAKYIHVCHYRSDENSVSVVVFGDPFWLEVRPEDTVADIKTRVQAKLEVPEKDFAKWKFSFHPRQMQPIEYLEDDDSVLDKFPKVPSFSESDNAKYYGDNGMFLGLEHEDSKPVKRAAAARYNTYERGIRIYTN